MNTTDNERPLVLRNRTIIIPAVVSPGVYRASADTDGNTEVKASIVGLTDVHLSATFTYPLADVEKIGGSVPRNLKVTSIGSSFVIEAVDFDDGHGWIQLRAH